MKNPMTSSLALCLFLAACGGGDAPEADMGGDDMMSDAPIGTVSIDQPAAGSTVTASTVTVNLSVAGFPIAQAGDMTPGTGHHHLFLDADVTDPTVPIPTVENSIVHMGDGSGTFTFTNVAPGEHRLIAVVADGAHVPLQPWVVDTVTFTVN